MKEEGREHEGKEIHKHGERKRVGNRRERKREKYKEKMRGERKGEWERES